MFTAKKDAEDEEIETNGAHDDEREINDLPVKDNEHNKLSLTMSNDSINSIDRKTKSPSPRILKDVMAEEIPQYKR